MKILLYISAASILLLSCRKVIDVDLNEAESKTVIEAYLQEGVSDFSVNISKTISYFTDEPIPAVKGAVVVLTDASGVKTTLLDNTDGTYLATNFDATSNQNYTLNIELATGEVFEAKSFMPRQVPLKAIVLDYEEKSIFGEAGYVPYTVFDDPIDETNFYRIILTKNGERRDALEDMFVFDDKFTNGNEIAIPLFSERLQIDDVIEIELISIDKATYDYYETLVSIASASGGGGDSAAPANPNNNISNDGLGYFAAISSDKLSVIVTE